MEFTVNLGLKFCGCLMKASQPNHLDVDLSHLTQRTVIWRLAGVYILLVSGFCLSGFIVVPAFSQLVLQLSFCYWMQFVKQCNKVSCIVLGLNCSY